MTQDNQNRSTMQRRRSSLQRRRSSFFSAARASFHRTRGQSGASVETLRGTCGADFEGYLSIQRGGDDGLFDHYLSFTDLFSCFGSSKKSKEGIYFVLIKGFHCFVFEDEESTSPKFAIELMDRRAVIQPKNHGRGNGVGYRVPHPGTDPADGNYTTIHLENIVGDVEYKFVCATHGSFEGIGCGSAHNMPSAFCAAVAGAAGEASLEQVRYKLGHEGELSKRASVRYANAIGKVKEADQPDAPLGTGRILSGMAGAGVVEIPDWDE